MTIFLVEEKNQQMVSRQLLLIEFQEQKNETSGFETQALFGINKG
jgi:hypothetical protein